MKQQPQEGNSILYITFLYIGVKVVGIGAKLIISSSLLLTSQDLQGFAPIYRLTDAYAEVYQQQLNI